MPLYKVRTYKHCNDANGEKWENVYTVLTSSPAAALTNGAFFKDAEQSVSYDWVSFDGFDVTLAAGGPVIAKTLAYFGQGALASAGLGGLLPLFNTVKVTFFNALGRPEVKYLRLGANANNIGSFDWDGAFVTYVDDHYTQVVVGNLEYVGPSGEFHASAVTAPQVQMRQVGWHRRSRPGYKRGWVPV